MALASASYARPCGVVGVRVFTVVGRGKGDGVDCAVGRREMMLMVVVLVTVCMHVRGFVCVFMRR